MRRVAATLVLLGAAMGVMAQNAGQPAPPQPKPAAGSRSSALLDPRSTAEILAEVTSRFESYKQSRDTAVLQDALAEVEIVLKREQLNTEANLLKAEMAYEGNDYDAARTHYRVVLDVEPNNFRANLGLGKIWSANRAWRQAVNFLEIAERVAPDGTRAAEVKQLLAVAYTSMGEVTKAIAKIEEATRMSPDNLDALNTLVNIRFQVASRDPAQISKAVTEADGLLARVKQAVEKSPADVALLGKLDQAYDLVISGLKLLHNNCYERDVRGQPTTRILKGKETDAAAALSRLAEIRNEQALLALTLARHQIITVAAAKAVELDPKNVKYLEALATLYRDVNDRDNAVATAQKILEVDPNHKGAREFLQSVGVAPGAPTTQPASATTPPASATPAPAAPVNPAPAPVNATPVPTTAPARP